ncbi:PspC domain-containing protein [Nocardioides nanhaiensis]|uniref:Phage shock protein PspC N-terminal domain-containing protein n=1 Tax=Nocardioides nanhaiensis TaxID=1476871 RepID=A0ABP8VZN8_9ACTN
MTTSPPEPGHESRPRLEPGATYETYEGPRVAASEMRDLARLRRSRTDRKVAGVAGGLAQHLDLDPLVLRVAFVVLAFFGGAGVLLYGAGWLLVPEQGTEEATVRLDDRNRTVALVLVGALAALALLGDTLGTGGGWWFPWPLLLAAGVVYLVSRNREGVAPPPAPATGAPAPSAATEPLARHGIVPGAPVGAAPPPWAPAPPTVRPVRPRRRGPVLFWPVLAVAGLTLGVLALLDGLGAGIADSAYPAAVLVVSGLGLLVGAFWGRGGGLIALGLVAALATAGSTAGDELGFRGLVSTPGSASDVEDSYRQTVGEIVLDLSEVTDPDELAGRTVQLDATLGRISVVLPPGLKTVVVSDVRLATVEVMGEEVGEGTTPVGGVTADDEEALRLEIDLRVGEIVVEEAA